MKMFFNLIISLVGFVSCESIGGMESIVAINNSEIEVSFYSYSLWPISLRYGQFYPDTLLMDDFPSVIDNLVHVPPLSSREIETEFNHRDIRQ